MNLTSVKINGKERTKDVLIEENISFDSLLLSENTLKGLQSCGFQKPSPIQLKALPLGKCGFDLIVKSKSGTGKTAVFAIIALEMIDPKKNTLQVLIIAPTREIAVQGCEVIKAMGAEFEGLKASCFIGGLSLEDDIAAARKCQIAVGSPGRIKHLINAGHLKTNQVRLLVLDEADKLMESSYQADINEIYHRMPVRKQMVVLSATYPDELDNFLGKYMITPTHVSPEADTPLLLGLKQVVCVVKPSLNVMQQMEIKIEQVVKLLSKISFGQCLIFSNFQTRAESVSNILNRRGWSSGFISGSQSQEERMCAIKDLKEYKCRILLSTDLTARGIDASNVDLVINYDVPHGASTYLHRMGRAGRYGARGICVTLAAKGKELHQLQNIIGMIGGRELTISQMPEEIPNGIWDTDFRDFVQIPGNIPDGNVTEESLKLKNIKSSILDLKSSRCKGAQEKSYETDNVMNSKRADVDSTTEDSSTEDILRRLSEGRRPSTEKEDDLHNNFNAGTSSVSISGKEDIKVASRNEVNSSTNKTILSNTEEASNTSRTRSEEGDKTAGSNIFKTLSQSDLSNKPNVQVGELNKSEANIFDTASILRVLSGESVQNSKQKLLAKPIHFEESGNVKMNKNLAGIDVFKLLSENDAETMGNCTEKQNTVRTAVDDGIVTIENNQEEIAGDNTVIPEKEITEIDDIKAKNDSCSKRKREDKKFVQQDKRKTPTICAKNISLMNVTKLLLDDDFNKVQEDITDNLTLYLDQIKHDTSENSLEEYSSESEKGNLNSHQEFQVENEEGIMVCSDKQAISDGKEDIFLLAYDCAINPSKPHWSEFVDYTDEIVEDEKVVNLLNCSEDYEQDDSEEMFHPRHKSRHRKKSWTKRKNAQISAENVVDAIQVSGFIDSNSTQDVAESNYPLGLYSYHEYGGCSTFDSSFEDCSKILANGESEFEDVEGFNIWFSQWQQQVQSVRDYVQQNVYLQEMNRYQYYKAQ